MKTAFRIGGLLLGALTITFLIGAGVDALLGQTTNPPGVVALAGANTPQAANHYVQVDTNQTLVSPLGLHGTHFYGGAFSNDVWSVDTFGNETTAGNITGGNVNAGGNMTAVNTFFDRAILTNNINVRTSTPSAWPTAPETRGACALVNSNSFVFLLQSDPGGNVWTSTNKIGK